MSNEVLPFISNEVANLCAEFDDDFLAEVFRIWDCDTQCWLHNSPILLRFENDDLLIWIEKGRLAANRGSVNTANAMLFISDPDGINAADVCLTWRVDHSWDYLAGETHLSWILLNSFNRFKR